MVVPPVKKTEKSEWRVTDAKLDISTFPRARGKVVAKKG